jgi:hypothetical protein
MPDPDRKSISATQSPALYNASPYITPWMLHQYLRGHAIDATETDRMRWGRRLQPLILDQAREDLKLEIAPNDAERYIRSAHVPLGYTSDAEIYCPDRGAGTVEVKCCFDYGTWMREWGGGAQPPRHVELQLQHQLAVGNGLEMFNWGVIAVWIGAEIKYFERKRDNDVSTDLFERATNFMTAVTADQAPDPFGAAIELPLLAKLFPTVKGKELDLRSAADAAAWTQMAVDLKAHKTDSAFHDKAAAALRETFLFMAKDCERVLLPGATLKLRTQHTKEHVRKASTHVNLSIELTGEEQGPQELPDGSPV